eukprot:2872830-Rhodomonas_salina.1
MLIRYALRRVRYPGTLSPTLCSYTHTHTHTLASLPPYAPTPFPVILCYAPTLLCCMLSSYGPPIRSYARVWYPGTLSPNPCSYALFYAPT